MENVQKMKILALIPSVVCIAAEAIDLPATRPADRLKEEWWRTRHEARVAEARARNHDLIFIGDSITQGWETKAKSVWETYYGHRHAFNLGFSGDRTEHVLWRLDHGEIEGQTPKLVVIMLGTNNTGHRKDPPEHTAEGIRLILERLRNRMPEAKVLLLAVFPREERPDGELRRLNDRLNELLQSLADGQRVVFLDINRELLQPDGTLSRDIMPDLLHPNEQGYRIWARAMEPTLARLFGDTPVPTP